MPILLVIVIVMVIVVIVTSVNCLCYLNLNKIFEPHTHNVHFIAAVFVFFQKPVIIAHVTLGFNVMSDLLFLFSTHHPLLQFFHRMSFWTIVAILTCLWSKMKKKFQYKTNIGIVKNSFQRCSALHTQD